MDTSIYDTSLPTNNFTLEITAPGFSDVQTITTLIPNYTVNLTACDLGLQISNCSNFNNNLPDGIYIIRQSIAPNDIVYVEYNHLRISEALNRYRAVVCCLDKTVNPDPETKKKILELRYIRELLDVAKSQVEVCHTPREGMTTYKYALSLLEKLECGCTNC